MKIMDFFFSHDWLNREAPYAFKPEHLIFIFVSVVIGFCLGIFLRAKTKKTSFIVIICLWVLSLLIGISYYSFTYYLCISDPTGHPFNIESMLPLHSCYMFMFICPFALFSKNHIVKTAASSFLVIVNMIMGFITMFVGCPTPGYSTFSFLGMQTLLYHALIFIVPLVMLITGVYDIKFDDFKYGLILFGALALTIWIFDAISGCDYFYIYDGHTFPVLKVISENVPSIVWTLITVSCYVITAVATHFLVIFVKYQAQKIIASKKQQLEQKSS